jgi:hypothetical protein
MHGWMLREAGCASLAHRALRIENDDSTHSLELVHSYSGSRSEVEYIKFNATLFETEVASISSCAFFRMSGFLLFWFPTIALETKNRNYC